METTRDISWRIAIIKKNISTVEIDMAMPKRFLLSKAYQVGLPLFYVGFSLHIYSKDGKGCYNDIQICCPFLNASYVYPVYGQPPSVASYPIKFIPICTKVSKLQYPDVTAT